MRGWVILLLVLALGGAVWFLGPWNDTPPELGFPDETPPVEEEERRGTDQVDESRERAADTGQRSADRPKRTVAVPITLVAHTVDGTGQDGAPLDDFRFRVTEERGREIAPWQQAKSGHELRLGVGSYAIEVTFPDHVPPGPARFTITRKSEPLTLRFPFRAIEALLLLEVLDATTKQRVTSFRATIETHVVTSPRPATRYVPKPDANPLPIPASRGEKLVVKIEAAGYTPAKPITVEFDGSVDRVEQKLFLAPAAKFTGVEIQVIDAARNPIPNLSVLVEKKLTDGTFAQVWRRRTADAKGVYKLPDLAPANYRLELRAVDPDGLPTLHLAHRFEFPFTGNEHVREYVTLNEGGCIELKLTDATGRTIGKDVSIAVTDANGKAVETIWRPLVDDKPDPKGSLSADHLTVDADARLERALPEGTYKITLQLAKGTAIEQQIYLRAGEVLELRQQLSR